MVVTVKLPIVQQGIVDSIIASVHSDPDWIENLFQRIQNDNPIVAVYCRTVSEVYGEHAGMVGLLVYRFLESQLEAEAML